MSQQFTATILLDRPWTLDVDALAEAVARRYPHLGGMYGVPGQRDPDSGILAMDGASVIVQTSSRRAPPDLIHPPQDIIRPWDPQAAIDGHRGHISISCGGRHPGIKGAMSYAAAVMFAVAGATDLVPARAILWQPSWVLAEPDTFCAATDALFEAHMPTSLWVSFAPYVPDGYSPKAAAGMTTRGLNRFLGRELDLAPRPGGITEAHRILQAVTARVLNEDRRIRSGDVINPGQGPLLTTHKRDCWFKRDQSAFVLVASDAILGREILKSAVAA